jgi:hypothetical protein
MRFSMALLVQIREKNADHTKRTHEFSFTPAQNPRVAEKNDSKYFEFNFPCRTIVDISNFNFPYRIANAIEIIMNTLCL